MSLDFTGKKINETYHRVVQYESGSGKLYNGLGVLISVSASALSASHAQRADIADNISGTITSASYAETAESASYAVSANSAGDYDARLVSLQSVSGSFAITGSNVFIGDQHISGALYVSESLHMEHIHFHPGGTPAYLEGNLYYDEDDDTLALQSSVSDVALQIGQEQWVKVVNKSGDTITNGMVVSISGSQGNRPAVIPNDVTDNTINTKVIGLATHEFVNNNNGFITVQGLVRGLDTSNFTVGQTLLSSGSNGEIGTNPFAVGSRPPNRIVRLGSCVVSHGTQGIILVDIKTFNLIGLEYDVSSSLYTPGDGNFLVYSGSDGLFDKSDHRGLNIDIDGNMRLTGSLFVSESVYGTVVSSSYTVSSSFSQTAASASTVNGLSITVGSGSPNFEYDTGSLYVDNEGYKLFTKADSGSYWQGIGHRDVAYLYISASNGTQPGTFGCELVAPATWSVSQYNTVYFCDDSQGDLQVILPDSDAYNQGKEMIFVKPRLVSSTNTVTLKTPSDQKITNTTRFDLEGPGDSLTITAVPFAADGMFGYRWRQTAYRLQDKNVLTVGSHGALFTTIGDAMNSITDSSTTNRYVIQVYPGDYQENNPIIGKDYVSINAFGRHEITRIYCVSASEHGLIAGTDVDYVGLQVKNCSGSGAAGYYVSGSVEDVDFHDCKTRDCDIGWLVDSSGQGLILKSSMITGGSGTTAIKGTSGSVICVNGFYTNDGVTLKNWMHCEGSSSKLTLNSSILKGDNTTNGLLVTDGGELEVASTHLSNVTTAMKIASGSGGTITGTGVDIQNSKTWDIFTESTSSVLRLTGMNSTLDKMLFATGSDITMITTDDKAGDKGLKVLGEFAVGLPELPAESIFGEGDSYTRGMKIYTFTTGTLAYKDVTVSASTVNDDLHVSFPSNSVNNMIYIASTLNNSSDKLKHFGVKMSIVQAIETGSGGKVSTEYWNGTSWTRFNRMFTDSGGTYLPRGQNPAHLTGSFQHRYDWTMNQDWTKNDPVGYGDDFYWTRYRIAADLSQSAWFDQIKLHSNRMEINSDGFVEYFGRARPYGTLPWDISQVKPGAASPGNQDVYLSDTLDVGRAENLFANNATDRIGFNAYLPEDLDTSCPVHLQWAVIGTTTAPTDTIDWVIRWGYSKDNDGVFTGAGTAPDYAANGSEQSQSFSVLPPTAAEQQKTYSKYLTLPNMVSRRASGSYGDILWATIQRTIGDAYDGAVTIINLTARYTKWCEGGHQF